MYKYLLFPLLLPLACFEESKDDPVDTDINDTDDVDDVSSVLAGQSYWLDSSEGFLPVAGTTVSLRFHEDTEAGARFSLSADCNSISGYLLINDATANVTLDGVTEMGCAEELNEQDTWLIEFITSGPGIELDGSYLTLTNSEATLVFIDQEIVNPDLPLTGTIWTVDSFIEDDMVSAMNLEQYPTIRFGDDGSVEIDTVCNTCSTSYSLADDMLTFDTPICSYAECQDDMAAEAESHVVEVFMNGDVFHSISADRLTLRSEVLGLSCLGE